MSRNGWEVLLDVPEWLGGPPGCPGVVGSLSRKFGRPSGCPAAGGRLSRMSLIGRRPFRMSGSCGEALPEVRQALPVVREWSGDTLGCP